MTQEGMNIEVAEEVIATCIHYHILLGTSPVVLMQANEKRGGN